MSWQARVEREVQGVLVATTTIELWWPFILSHNLWIAKQEGVGGKGSNG